MPPRERANEGQEQEPERDKNPGTQVSGTGEERTLPDPCMHASVCLFPNSLHGESNIDGTLGRCDHREDFSWYAHTTVLGKCTEKYCVLCITE